MMEDYERLDEMYERPTWSDEISILHEMIDLLFQKLKDQEIEINKLKQQNG